MQTVSRAICSSFFTVWKIASAAVVGVGKSMALGRRLALESDSFDPTKKSQMGFIHMALIVFAPLLLTILAVTMIAILSIYHITAADRVCKKEAMRLQHELSAVMKSLNKLNRRAQILRRKRDGAEKRLAAAIASGEPELIAAAEAYRRSVILEQEALALQQHRLIANAGDERELAEKRLLVQGKSWGIQNLRAIFSSKLAVRRDPPESITPDYLEKPNFPQQQSHVFQYKLNLFQRWPQWLQQHVLSHPNLRDLVTPFTTACAATLSTQEGNWKPILRKVRL